MADTSTALAIDPQKLNHFLENAVRDMGASLHAALIVIGDKLGLYQAMGDGTPLTPGELAAKTNTNERYVLEWLRANAASGYVEYDATTRRYWLSPEQRLALTTPDSPVHLPGFFHMAAACMRDEAKIVDAFLTGKGVGWHEHDPGLFHGCERFFRPNYVANLVSSWIPSLAGVEEKLKRGARVADIGCGHGASTILMAQAYPNSQFFGFDYHDRSIEHARQAAKDAGVDGRISFEVAPAKTFPGRDYDFVAFFDCLHDMGDPAGASKHVYESLASDGCWMIVEPFAHDNPEQNFNPVGRVYYSASTLVCTPASMAQEVGLALGAQAGESKLREVVTSGGFRHFRRTAETPFNMVFEAKA
jgi:SAM-dependent methyltransferase